VRIDKFLWSVRLFKTRSAATSHVRDGKVEVNGVAVKASRELRLGELIRVRSGAHHELHEVLAFPKGRVGAKLVGDYILDRTSEEERSRQAMTREMMRETPKGTGRPTKKDRRDWDKMNR
jgi:ribosome-associated heat shock protein Hsp15